MLGVIGQAGRPFTSPPSIYIAAKDRVARSRTTSAGRFALWVHSTSIPDPYRHALLEAKKVRVQDAVMEHVPAEHPATSRVFGPSRRSRRTIAQILRPRGIARVEFDYAGVFGTRAVG